ncbi:MAG TPA: hypothetical protein VLA04_04460 [Verrucomicrobiae bacterium]|nr:hypothetical protein [Verrucomicrobiae bacterium]
MNTEAYNGIGSEAVIKATGKDWAGWFSILDAWQATQHSHKEIAEYLHAEQGVAHWWCQMVTVGYEQARGLRIRNQTADGFEVSVTKVLPFTVGELYSAWMEGNRDKWLDIPITITTANESKSVRAKLEDGSRIAIGFYPKKTGAQIALGHEKMREEADIEKWRGIWKESIGKMASYLEK